MAWRRLIVYDADTMTPERWQRVRRILDRALELHGEERIAFLIEACGDDAALRADIETLLRADSRGGPPLDAPVEEYANALVAEMADRGAASESAIGRRVGPYRLIREIGRGGMGVVYLAERDDGEFDQRVALKLLPPGLDSAERERRLRSERQILASLEHSNIARLLDGGVTADGLPFLAMEYVDGVPIHRYCDEHRLGIKQRLTLVLHVCDAVQYAHRKLVVHRDLKPANILVTADGQAKLLDFGIAKLLDAEAGVPEAPLTRTGMRPMTPEYASPEQVRGEPITTGSDVYQLGVLLFELLTGQRPYRFDTRSPTEAERVICTQTPPRPSGVVRKSSPEPGETGRLRATTPARLERALRGDLDAVVLMALRKEPERRYASAAALADDVRRHLAALPIIARPDSLRYRARKFVHRHAVGVAASLGALLLIGAVMGVYTYRLARERDRAEQAGQEARIEAATAIQVSDFLEGLFEASDPYQRDVEEPTVSQLLDRSAQRVQSELADQPEVQARLLTALGRAYSNLGRYDDAEPLLQQALSLRRTTLTGSHPDVALSLREVAQLIYRRGHHAASRRLFEEALEIEEQALGGTHPQLAETLNRLGNVQKRLGDLRGSRARFKRALKIAEDGFGPDHLTVGRILNNLGLLLIEAEDYAEARDAFLRAVSIYERQLGPNHMMVAETLANLTTVQRRLGEHDQLVDTCKRYLTISERQVGSRHPSYANGLVCLGNAYDTMNRSAEAIPLYQQALDVYEQSVGPDHPFVAYPLGNLANEYRDSGDYERAIPLYRRTLTIWEDNHATQEIAHTLENYARLKLLMEEPSEAERDLRRALSLRQGLHPAGHWRIAATQSVLGESLTAQERYDEAEKYLLQGKAALELMTPSHRERTLKRLITLYEAWGKPQAASSHRATLAASQK